MSEHDPGAPLEAAIEAACQAGAKLPARLRAWAAMSAFPGLRAVLMEAAEALEGRDHEARQTQALERMALSLAKIAARGDETGLDGRGS